jgi:hypothetical protein
MATSKKTSSDQLELPVNLPPNTSAIYKTIMALRAAYGPIEDEEDRGLETHITHATSYARDNSFTKPE